jgi:hypothetical protein
VLRLAAVVCFTVAAFGWSLPWLDRAGTALVGLTLFALAPVVLARPRSRPVPPMRPIEDGAGATLSTAEMASLLGTHPEEEK